MSKFGLWQVGQGLPQKILETTVGLEKDLESWIEQDPSMLPGELEIVCRQMPMEGGRLDLLALDPLGRWVVVEIKAGAIQADTITQVMYYAAHIYRISYETLESKVHDYLVKRGRDLGSMLQERGLEKKDQQKDREVSLFLVGTHRAPAMETMLDYMSRKYHMPLTVITFEVFQLANGQRILVREFSETDVPVRQKPKAAQRSTADVEKVCKLADQTGIGKEFRLLLEESRRLGFYPRPYVRSIMFTHPDHKNRMLFSIWAHLKPLNAYIGYEAFADYYSVTEEQVAGALGPAGSRRLDLEAVQQLVAGLNKIISNGVNTTDS